MKLEEIIKLIDAGYSKEEIQAMNQPEETPAEQKEQPEQKAQEAQPAAPAVDLSALQKELADIKKGLYAMNIMNSSQPEKKNADDVLKAVMDGGRKEAK